MYKEKQYSQYHYEKMSLVVFSLYLVLLDRERRLVSKLKKTLYYTLLGFYFSLIKISQLISQQFSLLNVHPTF